MRSLSWLLSVGDVERDHRSSENIIGTSKRMKQQTFLAHRSNVAMSKHLAVATEGIRSMLGSVQKAMRSTHEFAQAVVPEECTRTSSSTSWLRKQSALQLWKYDELARRKLTNENERLHTGQGEKFRMQLDALSQDDKVHYEQLAANSAIIAKENLENRKRERLARGQLASQMLLKADRTMPAVADVVGEVLSRPGNFHLLPWTSHLPNKLGLFYNRPGSQLAPPLPPVLYV